MLEVIVKDGNVDNALHTLRKKMQRDGVNRLLKRRYYEKKSEKRARKKAENARRKRKIHIRAIRFEL